MEKEAREEEKKEQQQQDHEEYDTGPEINLVHEGRHVKEFRVTGNLNNANTRMIMDNITPHTEMRTKVIYHSKQRSIVVLVKSWITARH